MSRGYFEANLVRLTRIYAILFLTKTMPAPAEQGRPAPKVIGPDLSKGVPEPGSVKKGLDNILAGIQNETVQALDTAVINRLTQLGEKKPESLFDYTMSMTSRA